MVYPDAWEAFVANFSESERADLEAATYRRIRGGDEQVAAQTAKALAIWELASVHFHPRERNAGAMRGEGVRRYLRPDHQSLLRERLLSRR